MKRILVTMMLASALAIALPMAAQAQPCTPHYPAELHLGESACIQLCQFSLINFFLVGADLDEVGVPVLTAVPGCNLANSNCDVNCTAINPPTFFTLGGGIFFPDPNDWGGSSDCMEIAYRWNHDGYWEIEIFSLCTGCFCLTFEDQFAAELSSFHAVPANGAVTVNFSTASESNLDRFNIKRDGVLQTTISATNNASGHNYSWVDANVVNGTSYTYTLESVDMTGHVEVLGATNATPEASNPNVAKFALDQNFPNPFNPETNINFELAEASNVSLRVFNLIGQEVATLVSGQQAAGHHTVSFNASSLPSGMYIYRLEAGAYSATRKMVLMK